MNVHDEVVPNDVETGEEDDDEPSKAHSRIDVTVNGGSNRYVVRGRRSSVIRVTLVPTDFRDMIQGFQLFGFVAQFQELAHRGSL